MSAKDLYVRLALHPARRRYLLLKHTQYFYASHHTTLRGIFCGQGIDP